MMKAILVGLAAAMVSIAAFGQQPPSPRVLSEACALISQQRNAVSDAVAVAEAQRKITQERLDQWEAYFKAYVGEAKS